MNLENKERVDFVDSHLWAAAARFFVSIQIKNIPFFLGIFSDFKMIVHPHMDDSSDTDYFVNVEFIPCLETMRPDRTERKLKELIALCCQYGGYANITLDDVGARLDANGNITERWANEPAR